METRMEVTQETNHHCAPPPSLPVSCLVYFFIQSMLESKLYLIGSMQCEHITVLSFANTKKDLINVICMTFSTS